MSQRAISIAVGATCIILLLVSTPRLPPRPRSYHEAVIQVLDARSISYRKVEVDSFCPQHSERCQENLFPWILTTMNVRIATERPPSAIGQITCRYYQGDCSLSVPQLELVNAPLRDLAGVHSRPTRFDYILEYVKALRRVWTQRIWTYIYETGQ